VADEQKPESQPKNEREQKAAQPEGAKAPKQPKPQAAAKPQAGGKQAAAQKQAQKGPKPAPREEEPQVPVTVANLRDRYEREVKPQLREQFRYGNVMRVPRVEKVVVNIGLGEAISNPKAMDAAAGDLATITGQRAVVTRSKKAISNFRLRKGMPIGLKVTLRGYRMWHFLEKLLTTALPRIRDFQGVPDRSFDGRGNYSLGLREQLVFPEIEYDKIDRLRGMEITVVTSAKTDEEGRRLLQLLGMPFRRAS
jgi:large subunit ribosomal protein L5